jgi:hypothetical protein
LAEELEVGTRAFSIYRAEAKDLSNCLNLRVSTPGVVMKASVSDASSPRVGDRSRSFTLVLTRGGVVFTTDMVYFEVNHYVGFIYYGAFGVPNLKRFESFVNEAIAKIRGNAVVPTGTRVSIRL